MNKTDRVLNTILGKEVDVVEAPQVVEIKTVGDLLRAGYGATTEEGRKVLAEKTAVEIFNEAEAAGEKAGAACVLRPMVVQQHASSADDNSPVVKEWFVDDGLCGFAWVNVQCKNKESRRFINELKKKGLAGDINSRARWSKDSYYKGYTYWVWYGNQSIARKEAFAHAFADVLKKYGIDAHVGSRLD